VTEFHAARLLLLLHLGSTSNRIDGLTKLAKLDFFVRYPEFFARAASYSGSGVALASSARVEAPMIRHHYGPWDPRYYQVLAYLEGRELVTVSKDRKAFVFTLTDNGISVARQLASNEAFQNLSAQIQAVKRIFGKKSGDTLKKLVYRIFDAEVAQLALGEAIQQ